MTPLTKKQRDAWRAGVQPLVGSVCGSAAMGTIIGPSGVIALLDALDRVETLCEKQQARTNLYGTAGVLYVYEVRAAMRGDSSDDA